MGLPPQLVEERDRIRGVAKSLGLDFFETVFVLLNYERMCEVASFEGFPQRYPHWRFGMEFERNYKLHGYGLAKIYELVINNDPCFAYLLEGNSMMEQKLVIAHVYGHSDFFKNNAWFSKTNRRMLDQMANHAARINRYIDRHGQETVEEFIDACLSLEDLLDPHLPHVQREDAVDAGNAEAEKTESDEAPGRFASKDYMDAFINPPEVLERQADERAEKAEELEQARSFPNETRRAAVPATACLLETLTA